MGMLAYESKCNCCFGAATDGRRGVDGLVVRDIAFRRCIGTDVNAMTGSGDGVILEAISGVP